MPQFVKIKEFVLEYKLRTISFEKYLVWGKMTAELNGLLGLIYIDLSPFTMDSQLVYCTLSNSDIEST